MIAVILICALLTVLCLVFLLTPLMLAGGKPHLAAWVLLLAMTAGAMGFYFWRGQPAIPSQPALLATSGPDFEKRRLVRKELELSRLLAARPDDAALMLSLGAVRLQNGRIAPAIAVLTQAHDLGPDEIAPIKLKLGAAHYAAALEAFFVEGNRERAQTHFQKALEIAPEDAPYREKLSRDYKNFQDEA